MIIGINGKIGSGKDTVGKIIQYLVDFYTLKRNFPEDIPDNIPDNPNEKDFDDWLFNDGDDNENNIWKIKKFAGKLKQIASLLTGIDVEDLEKEEVKNSVLGEEWWYYGDMGERISYLRHNPTEQDKKYLTKPTVRQFLQRLGTEAIRNNIHENAWVNALFVDYKTVSLPDETTFIKDDKKWIDERSSKWIITDVRFPNELKAVKDRKGICIRINRLNSTPQTTFVNKHDRTHPSETALDNAEFDYVIDNNSTINDLIRKVKTILIKKKII